MADLGKSAERASLTEAMFSFAVFAIAACGLYASSLYSYLLLHTLGTVLHVRHALPRFFCHGLAEASGQPIFLISFTQSRVLELLHTFAYQGLGIFLAPYTITTAFYADN